MTASFVGVVLAVAHVAQGVADGAGFRGPLSDSLRVARRAKAPVPTQARTTLTLLLQDGRTPRGCQRLMEAIQKGESEVCVCCEGRTIRHGAHRRGG